MNPPAPVLCPADLTGDNFVAGDDMGLLLGQFGACSSCAADLSGDGLVASDDIGIMLGAWGPCP
jgi:hypothetical protein